MATAWQTPGMDSPWKEAVGECSAPVGQNKILFHLPARIPFSWYPVRTEAQQPQPEPPQWTS